MKLSSKSASERTVSKRGSDGNRWAAIVHKDRKADGKLWFAVKTTGVYCRPSCPSRLANRENVLFYDSWQEAEVAGFRACKRCEPRGPGLQERRALAVAAACRNIESAEELPKLGALAAGMGLSPFHFHRIFKEITGLTPKSYAQAHRARRVRDELTRRHTVTEAIYEAGFNSNGRFYAKSAAMLGMRPARFRAGGAGECIRFAIGKCVLGSILVAVSEQGVCAVSLGDDLPSLARELQKRFPRAELIAGDRALAATVAQVVALVQAPNVGLHLPLDVRGTAFQQRVWDALRKIPVGSTLSYLELAKRIGCPKSVRAVASACASNKIAVAIPCHRVVRTDGAISGYRWGVRRKRALLSLERRAAS